MKAGPFEIDERHYQPAPECQVKVVAPIPLPGGHGSVMFDVRALGFDSHQDLVSTPDWREIVSRLLARETVRGRLGRTPPLPARISADPESSHFHPAYPFIDVYLNGVQQSNVVYADVPGGYIVLLGGEAVWGNVDLRWRKI